MERLRLVRLLQPENIPDILVTLEVLKLERLRLVRLLQPLNILPIYVTLEVLKLSPKSILVSAD